MAIRQSNVNRGSFLERGRAQVLYVIEILFYSSISDGQSWSHLRAFVVHKRLLIVLLSSEEHLISSIEISIKNSSSQAFRGSTKTRRKSRIQSKIISLIRSNNLMFSPPSRIFPLFRNLLNEFTQNCHKRRLEWSYIIHIFCMEIWGTFFRIMGVGLRNAASRLNPGWTTTRAMKEKNRMDFVLGLGWGWGGAWGWRDRDDEHLADARYDCQSEASAYCLFIFIHLFRAGHFPRQASAWWTVHPSLFVVVREVVFHFVLI